MILLALFLKSIFLQSSVESCKIDKESGVCCFNFYTNENGHCIPMGKETTSVWVNVTFAIIGSITAVTMCLIVLLFYLKSWISKTSVSPRGTNQLYTDQTDDQEEHGDESRRSSSNRTETVLQGTPTHSYTGLRFSRMQPLYDNSKDYESVPEQDALSVDSLPSHKLKNDYKEDDDGEAKYEGKYERLFKDKAYNVLSLRIPPFEKAMTLRSVISSINLINSMEGDYDSIEDKGEYVSERRADKIDISGKDLCGEKSIEETLKDFIGNAQKNRKCDITVDMEAISKSLITQEFDCTKSFSPRPYSFANSIWRKHYTSKMSNQTRISEHEEVSALQTDEENIVHELTFSKSDMNNIIEISEYQTIADVS